MNVPEELLGDAEVPLIVNVTRQLAASYDCLFAAMFWLGGDAGKHVCATDWDTRDGACSVIRPVLVEKGWAEQ